MTFSLSGKSFYESFLQYIVITFNSFGENEVSAFLLQVASA